MLKKALKVQHNLPHRKSLLFRWLHEIDANCDVVNRILVGNKNDDPDRKVVVELIRQMTQDQFLLGRADRGCPEICRSNGDPAV